MSACWLLVAVGGEPSEIAVFVDDIEVVVGLTIERHANVDRMQELVFLHVVARDVDVVAAESVATLSSEVQRLTVTHHKRIVDTRKLSVVVDTFQ